MTTLSHNNKYANVQICKCAEHKPKVKFNSKHEKLSVDGEVQLDTVTGSIKAYSKNFDATDVNLKQPRAGRVTDDNNQVVLLPLLLWTRTTAWFSLVESSGSNVPQKVRHVSHSG